MPVAEAIVPVAEPGAALGTGPGATRRPRQAAGAGFGVVLVLYLATVAADAVRKATALPGSVTAVTYVLTGLTYLVVLRRGRGRTAGPLPRSLPVWLALLTLWCLVEAVVDRVPPTMAALGLVTYVFFVPLVYVGARLMSDDRRAAVALRVAAVTGGVVGFGAVASSVLGQYAPAVLQPINPAVGFHSFSGGDIYLSPSVFATAEEASEQLLIALFAWFALAQLPGGRLRRGSSVVLAVLIGTGLFATSRRADIAVAVAGVVGLMFLGVLARRWRVPGPAGTHSAEPTGGLLPPGGLLPLGGPQRTRRSGGRLGPALFLAGAATVALIAQLGAGKLTPFLTSGSSGVSAVRLMFSPSHPGSLSGQGPGTSTQGATLVGATSVTGATSHGSYVASVVGGRSFMSAEGGLTKTWLELGIIGVVLYAGVFACVLFPALRRLSRLDGVGRALTVLTLALGVVFLKGHASLDNPLIQPLFWLAAGGAWGRMHTAAARPGRPAPAALAPGGAGRVADQPGLRRPPAVSPPAS